jgi:hypothetical protein
MRVGQFIGRLGVVSLPAVQVGLDVDERVVRRHVAKLEAMGWLGRAPWVWGEGSIAWLTGAGMEGTGLGGLRAVKAPPSPTTAAHGVLVGWSAARAEKRGRVWKSARELALEPERWAVPVRCERGYTKQLPDLAVWLKRSGPPVALISESGGRREDRQKKILEAWGDAAFDGRYAGVLYDCANDSVARAIIRLVNKLVMRSKFTVVVQPRAEEIAALLPAAGEPDDQPTSSPQATDEHADATQSQEPEQDRGGAPASAESVVAARPAPPAEPEPETPEAASERERQYRQMLGIPEPKPRRRWRR